MVASFGWHDCECAQTLSIDCCHYIVSMLKVNEECQKYPIKRLLPKIDKKLPKTAAI
jgi:hypothetical protein